MKKEIVVTLIWVVAIPLIFLFIFLSFGLVFASIQQIPNSKGAAIIGGLIGAGAALVLTPIVVYFLRKKLRRAFLKK